MSSADNLVKQFGPRSGLTNRRASSGSKLFDILMVFFQKIDSEKNQQTTKKKHEKHPGCNELTGLLNIFWADNTFIQEHTGKRGSVQVIYCIQDQVFMS